MLEVAQHNKSLRRNHQVGRLSHKRYLHPVSFTVSPQVLDEECAVKLSVIVNRERLDRFLK